MKVVAYYTPGVYATEAKRLIKSLNAAEVDDYLVAEVESRGDWYDNTAYKAKYIDACMSALNCPLLYVDVDAVMHYDVRPYFETLDCDFAAHWHAGHMLSGTLYFANTDNARRLISLWMETNARQHADGNRHVLEQANLQSAAESVSGLRVQPLGPEFCYIFDTHAKEYPDAAPLIEHLQASRETHWSASPDNPTVVARRARVTAIDAELASR